MLLQGFTSDNCENNSKIIQISKWTSTVELLQLSSNDPLTLRKVNTRRSKYKELSQNFKNAYLGRI